MKIRPISGRVVVRRGEIAKVTASGIHIPDSAQNTTFEGTVEAVGIGELDSKNRLTEPRVKAGDRVLFARLEGDIHDEVSPGLVVIPHKDILGIVR